MSADVPRYPSTLTPIARRLCGLRRRAGADEFESALRIALVADFVEVELQVCLRYGVIKAAGWKRSEAGKYLGEPDKSMRSAEQRVRNASLRLDLGDDD